MYRRFLRAGATKSRPNSWKTSFSPGVSTSSHSVSSFVSDCSDQVQPFGRRHSPWSFKRAPALLACDRICLTNSTSPVIPTRAAPLLPEGIRLQSCQSQRGFRHGNGGERTLRPVDSTLHSLQATSRLHPVGEQCPAISSARKSRLLRGFLPPSGKGSHSIVTVRPPAADPSLSSRYWYDWYSEGVYRYK